jgi:hypothetical protein
MADFRLLGTSYKKFEGLSTDVKPTLTSSDTAWAEETDTGNVYTWNGTAWVIKNNHVYTGWTSTTGALAGFKQADGKPRFSAMPYTYDIAEGNVSGHTLFAKLGYNADVGATEEDIWTIGGAYVYPSTPMGMQIISSSPNDTALGTGLRSVRISYLDDTYAGLTETVTLSGTTAVPTVATNILRVNSIRVVTAGSTNVAAGDINCTNTTGAVVYRSITAGFTRGRGAIYTVPLSKTLYITTIHVSSGYTTVGKVVRWTGRANYDDVSGTILPVGLFMAHFEAMTQDMTDTRELTVPMRIPATCDVKMSAVSNGAGSFCQCSIRGWLE